jgi:esterase/lipase superfamily enzyme
VSGNIELPNSVPPDPREDFVIGQARYLTGESSFVGSINASLAERPWKDRDILLFVHGFNTDMTAAIMRMAQFVEDSGYTGVPLLFSWASSGKALEYVYDMNSVFHARDGLVSTAILLEQTNAAGYDVVAHSMGNLLTMEAIRQFSLTERFNETGRLRSIILASPDIDIDLFRVQVASVRPDQRNFIVLISDDDDALAISRRLAGGVPRVGDADAATLAELGVDVIDLSEIQDGGLHHSKFADSPQVVQLIGNRYAAGDQFTRPLGGMGKMVSVTTSGLHQLVP